MVTGSRRRRLGRLGDNVPIDSKVEEVEEPRLVVDVPSGSIIIPDEVAQRRDTILPPPEGPKGRRKKLGIEEDLR